MQQPYGHTDKSRLAVQSFEASGWKRFKTLPRLGRWIVCRKSELKGHLLDFKTIFRNGRIVNGCYER
jgi:hypothetical protein